MQLTIKEVIAKAGSEQIAMVRDGCVFYIVLNNKLNMMDFEFIAKFNLYLDAIEKSEGPAILVTLNSGSKAFSAGFNLMTIAEAKFNSYLLPLEFLKLMGRLIKLGVPSLAAANGHCVAGGLFLALCHDKFLVGSNPKIKLQLNESLIGMQMYPPFSIAMHDLLEGFDRKKLLLGTVISPQHAKKMDLC